MPIDHRLKERLALIAAIFVFALAQFSSFVHAEDDHDAHISSEDCAICCLAFTDDDPDATANVCDIDFHRTLKRKISIPESQVDTFRLHSYSITRGPPRN